MNKYAATSINNISGVLLKFLAKSSANFLQFLSIDIVTFSQASTKKNKDISYFKLK